ncbi:MAG: LytTR family DNA-binding domain-containing protein [Brevundimonas sp.]|nr:LytTR family DNA-binding domain-containing protein [Brevundimonas sp.]
MGDQAVRAGEVSARRRWALDLGLLAAIGLMMGFLAPFASDQAPVVGRYAHWMVVMVGCGLIGVWLDRVLSRRVGALWRRTLVVSVVMTPPSALLVMASGRLLAGGRFTGPIYLDLLWQVWPVCLAVMAVRAVVWRRAPVKVETRTVIAAPLPDAEAAFRRRLSAKRRGARLIAVEAHDHYLKVHTDAGEELITLRFADALTELAGAYGWRVHRSWWVAAEAVESARWRRGVGELTLAGGLTAPVSRTYRAVLKEAGWG